MSVDEYERKRDFRQSAVPGGGDHGASTVSRLHFVIQRHEAPSLYVDFRLEHDGVLKSWAVPRGPSLDPRAKRLAVEVEDDPLEYVKFKGTIPKGHYGAGRVLVWDTGTWQPNDDVVAMLRSGKLKFKLYRQRLRGEWRLFCTYQKGRQPQWLLSKVDDDGARWDVEIIESNVESLVQQCRSLGLEGIVSKQGDRSCRSGCGADWLKTKFRCREHGIVIGLALTGGPSSLSRLLVGYFSDDRGLRLALRVGTDWSEIHSGQTVKRLATLSVERSPLANTSPIPKRGRDREVDLQWLQPVAVAAIEFAGWKDTKPLRQASFVELL